MTEKITKETTLDKIVEVKGAEEVLRKQGVPCVSCPMAAREMKFLKLGEIWRRYGIGADKLLEELNRLGEKK